MRRPESRFSGQCKTKSWRAATAVTAGDDGLWHVQHADAHTHAGPASTAQTLLYTAPELLDASQSTAQPAGLNIKRTTDSEVSSYGMTLYELFAGQNPFRGVSSHKVAWLITCGKQPFICQENVSNGTEGQDLSYAAHAMGDVMPVPVAHIFESCWQQEPYLRPAFSQVLMVLEAATIALQMQLD